MDQRCNCEMNHLRAEIEKMKLEISKLEMKTEKQRTDIIQPEITFMDIALVCVILYASYYFWTYLKEMGLGWKAF